jgi:hypothetical protein
MGYVLMAWDIVKHRENFTFALPLPQALMAYSE